jgi:mannose-6-phosphate isomerase-like protein (cupin superfamily)
MGEATNYEIREDIRFDGLETMDLPALVDECQHDWFNQSLCRVNDSVLRLGVFKGEFHVHKHDREDEFFLVLDGKLLVDFEDETVKLRQHQGILIPRGVVHRTRSPERSVVLMIEGDTVVPTGDA